MKKKDLDDAVRRVFRRHEFCAVYVAGPSEVVPRKMGDNRGGRPIKLGITRALEDTISSHLDGASAYYEQRVLFRVWVQSFPVARKLEGLVIQALGVNAEGLRKAFWDMGADFQLEFFEMEIHTIAQCNGIKTWDDDSLFFDLAHEVKREFAKKGKVSA